MKYTHFEVQLGELIEYCTCSTMLYLLFTNNKVLLYSGQPSLMRAAQYLL